VSRLPYFDLILREIENGNQSVAISLGDHVHWGYWPDPNHADGSLPDFKRAGDQLCGRLCELGRLSHAMRIADVGCGFGGTIRYLDRSYQHLSLVGINIDQRQIKRARALTRAEAPNAVQFIAADACSLPLPDSNFDAVLAVECIFHFPSRDQFFAEARRVLRPGGRLLLSDFVLFDPDGFGSSARALGDWFVNHFYGESRRCTLAQYRQLATAHGFRLSEIEDANQRTLPTFKVLLHLPQKTSLSAIGTRAVTHLIYWAQRLGAVRYLLLCLEKR
jgi:cyclopropane fatty-acyl-phospholipid synthase-like methyltransferase